MMLNSSKATKFENIFASFYDAEEEKRTTKWGYHRHQTYFLHLLLGVELHLSLYMAREFHEFTQAHGCITG